MTPLDRTEATPDLPGFDSTMAFLRDGYDFVGRRCSELGADGFRTRLMLKPVTFLRGADAARAFYQPGRMTRRGAMPASVVALLQDKGSVQTLDREEHRVRKSMFLDLMTEAALDDARAIYAEEWHAASEGWHGSTIALRDELRDIMTRSALRWCGIRPEEEDVPARAEELATMIGAAGSVGPRYLRARTLRARSERWACQLIEKAREDGADQSSPVARVASHHDADGDLITVPEGAVELINLLRPIVAVGRYIVFLAHALHVHREEIARLGDAGPDKDKAICEEVRRLYPFFPLIGGRVMEPFDWRGRHFDADDWVLLDLYGTNRDPAAWDSPEEFRPERHVEPHETDAMVPQGGGDYLQNHRCPGEWLTVALMAQALPLLRALNYSVPDQDLRIPHDEFPPWPRDGMRITVGPSD